MARWSQMERIFHQYLFCISLVSLSLGVLRFALTLYGAVKASTPKRLDYSAEPGFWGCLLWVNWAGPVKQTPIQRTKGASEYLQQGFLMGFVLPSFQSTWHPIQNQLFLAMRLKTHRLQNSSESPGSHHLSQLALQVLQQWWPMAFTNWSTGEIQKCLCTWSTCV